MAHFAQSHPELAVRLQKAVGLGDKILASLNVSMEVGQDLIVKTTVTFVEYTEVKQQEAITEVVEMVSELSEVEYGR